MAENTKRDSNKPPKPGSPEKPVGNQDRPNPNKNKTTPEAPPDRTRQSENSPNRMAPDKARVNDDLDLDLDDEDDRAAQRSPRPDRDDKV